jgi:hypothetical protein
VAEKQWVLMAAEIIGKRAKLSDNPIEREVLTTVTFLLWSLFNKSFYKCNWDARTLSINDIRHKNQMPLF